MNEETINQLETLHNKIYKETEEYGRTQFVSRIVDLEKEKQEQYSRGYDRGVLDTVEKAQELQHNWNELKEYVYRQKELNNKGYEGIFNLVLSKMQELEEGGNNE